MRTSKSTIAIVFVMLLVLFSCNKKENKINDANFISGNMSNVSSGNKLLAHIPMPAKLDSAMRHSFDSVTYKILKNINPKNVKSFTISKDNYIKMIEDFPANADRVAFSFVQFNKASFPAKYKELSKYDGCLYLVYYYMDSTGKNVGDKAYAMLGLPNIVEIDAADFDVMINDYLKNIKSKIDNVVKGTQGNTLRVKIKKDELLAYKARISTKKDIKNFKITLAQWVDYSNYITKNEKGLLMNRLSQFSPDSQGQMTFITDCKSTSGGDVQDLSGSELQPFCPNDCP